MGYTVGTGVATAWRLTNNISNNFNAVRQSSSHQPYWGKVVLAPCAQHCLPHTHVWTPVSEHCMTTLVTQPWQYTLQPRLLTLCSSVAALVFSSPLRRRDFSCWSFKFQYLPRKGVFWPVAVTSRWWSLEQFSFQIYIWKHYLISFGKFYTFELSNHPIFQFFWERFWYISGLFLVEFPPIHLSLHVETTINSWLVYVQFRNSLTWALWHINWSRARGQINSGFTFRCT